MKKYEKPTMEVITISNDVIVTSPNCDTQGNWVCGID